MATPLLPIIKAVAPYIAQITTIAIPAFTSKPKEAKTDPVVSKQIEELQKAATQNAESIHLLAEKMKQAIQDIESASQSAKKQIAAYKILLFSSLGLSAVAIVTSFYVIMSKF